MALAKKSFTDLVKLLNQTPNKKNLTTEFKLKKDGSIIHLDLSNAPLGVAVRTDVFIRVMQPDGSLRTVKTLPSSSTGNISADLGDDNYLSDKILSIFSTVAATTQSGAPCVLSLASNLTGGAIPWSNKLLKMNVNSVGDAITFTIEVSFY